MINQKILEKFHQGMCLNAYEVFGAHFENVNSTNGVRFTVWAPEAIAISVGMCRPCHHRIATSRAKAMEAERAAHLGLQDDPSKSTLLGA